MHILPEIKVSLKKCGPATCNIKQNLWLMPYFMNKSGATHVFHLTFKSQWTLRNNVKVTWTWCLSLFQQVSRGQWQQSFHDSMHDWQMNATVGKKKKKSIKWIKMEIWMLDWFGAACWGYVREFLTSEPLHVRSRYKVLSDASNVNFPSAGPSPSRLAFRACSKNPLNLDDSLPLSVTRKLIEN